MQYDVYPDFSFQDYSMWQNEFRGVYPKICQYDKSTCFSPAFRKPLLFVGPQI